VRIRIRITGDTHDRAFVMGSLLERLPKGVVFHARADESEATVEVEPLELLKSMLYERLTQIDPARRTSVDWRVERDEGARWETPRIEDIEDPLAFAVTIADADTLRLDALFPAATDHWPGGVLFREGSSDDFGNYQLRVEVLPRWLVERAVADSIREYDPALALTLGRVQAQQVTEEEPPVKRKRAAGDRRAARPLPTPPVEEYPEGPAVIEGMWAVLAKIADDRWHAEHPGTGLLGVGVTQQEAIEAMVKKVMGRKDAAG
jgi:hypothetical protein